MLEKEKQGLAQLLKFEQRELSRQAVDATLEHHVSYYTNDRVIVDFSSCIDIEEGEMTDIKDVLEYAKIQLLELRYYDHLVDVKLGSVYKSMLPGTGQKNIDAAISELSKFKLWVSETIEKVENVLKPIGDIYLAKVYRFAAYEFHLREWERSVGSRLKDVDDIYHKLNDQKLAKQNFYYEVILVILELVIVLLIVFEIVIAFK